MGCGCGKKNASVKYVFVDTNGTQRSYRTEIEARAAQIRAGGGGSIKTAPLT